MILLKILCVTKTIMRGRELRDQLNHFFLNNIKKTRLWYCLGPITKIPLRKTIHLNLLETKFFKLVAKKID